MRITVDGGLLASATAVDVDVVAGATVAEILETLGASRSDAWCGRQRLTPDHAAGVYPLIHGAFMGGAPGPACAPPRGPHLAVIAGPDSGMVVECDGQVTIGRAADLSIADHAMSRVHAIAVATGDGFTVRDAGSTNGVGTARDPRMPDAVARDRRSGWSPGRVAVMGETWVALRGAQDSASATPAVADAPAPGETAAAPRRVAAMTGAGASAIALAAITGRWYLALLALVYPAITFAPDLVRRLRPERVAPLLRLPDPTDPGSAAFRRSVAITGDPALREPTARAEILARGRRPPPHPQGLTEDWLEWLPPAQPGDGEVILADAAPSWCDRELVATTNATEVRERGQPAVQSAVVRVSESTAEWGARRIAGGQLRADLPTEVRWGDVRWGDVRGGDVHRANRHSRDVPQPGTASEGARRLSVPLGLAATESGSTPWFLDLDADGPHLLIAGTTGSGKSALLHTLVLALAAAFGPRDVELALLDFKGGAALASCAALPHVVGVVTDLDGHQARRALSALGAALAERKVQLAATTHTSYAQWEASGDAPPRMVVVVDEFQEIGALHRDFVPELTRLAAQGRSLGMHLVLATQRPSGAVTPEIRANMSTTIALRVASDAESRDLVGTADAALLPSDVPGRAIVASGGVRLTVQAALPVATPSPRVRRADAPRPAPPADLMEWALAAHPTSGRAHPLWHPPLPDHVRTQDLLTTPGAVPVGLADRPERRQRETLNWDPRTGPLAVIGAPGQARAALLDAVAAGAAQMGLRPVRLPEDPREAARTMWLTESAHDTLLIVEDVASALGALARVDRGAAGDVLLARAASAKPLAFALGAGGHHRIATHAAMRLVMTGLAPQDDSLWGVPRELADIARHPRAVRAWSADGWCEARISACESAQLMPLVAPVPTHVDLTGDGGLVGMGGDQAQPVAVVPGGACAVVGPAGTERDDVVELLVAAGAGEVCVAEAPMFLPAGAREGLVVAIAPTPRVSQDLCRDGALGLVDEHPARGRVLWVQDGIGWCVQLGTRALVKDPA